MQLDTNIAAGSADQTDQIVKTAQRVNIASCLAGLVLLAYLDRSDLGGHAIALIAVVLLSFAGTSFAMFREATVMPYPAFLLLGFVNIVAGLVIPVQTEYGAAFSANFLTLGIMVLVSLLMQRLTTRNRKDRMAAAWDMMLCGLVLAPAAALVSALLFLALGFPMTVALPAACLTVIAVIPLATLAIIIHGNPFVRGPHASKP